MDGVFSWGDICGIAGVVLYVGSYFGLQAGLVTGRGYAYASLNTLAAVCVLLSLTTAFNLSSAVIQVVWIVIGIYGMARSYTTDRRLRFSDEERVFLGVVVPGLDRRAGRQLLDRGRWKTALPGVRLTEAGKRPGHVHFFLAGSADVFVAGRRVGQIGPMSLVGEDAYLSAGHATATVLVTRPSRVLSIDAGELRAYLVGNAEIRNAVEARFGNEVGAKLRASHGTLACLRGAPRQHSDWGRQLRQLQSRMEMPAGLGDGHPHPELLPQVANAKRSASGCGA